MTVKEMAHGYYPRLWPLERLDALLMAGRLTQEEYEDIIAGAEMKG